MQSVNLWSDKGSIDIANPLRQEESRLRTSLLPSLITTKRYNMDHGTERVKIYEIARIYLAGNTLPEEKACLAIVADTDFLTLKGIVESLFQNLGMPLKQEWTGFNESKLFLDERSASIQMDNTVLGYLGEVTGELGFKTQSCLAEIDLDILIEKSLFAKKYQKIPPYPPVFRDLAIIVNEEVTWSSVEKCVAEAKAALLKEMHFFDVYYGKQVPAGKKSIAFNLCFQAQDRTLTNEEVDSSQKIILDTLYKILGAELRKA